MCDCKDNDEYQVKNGDHLPTLIIWESLDLKPSGRLEETSQLVLLHINLDPYILKVNKLAVIYFWAQKNWRKKCVHQDDKILR